MQEVHTAFGVVKHTVTLSNSPGSDGGSIAISNQVDITNENNKVPLAQALNNIKIYWLVYIAVTSFHHKLKNCRIFSDLLEVAYYKSVTGCTYFILL